MKRFALFVLAIVCAAVTSVVISAITVPTASAQTPSNSIIVDAASFRPVQTDALTGIAIDPIGLDGSKRPCTRLKMRINRMTREEIGELSFRLRGGVIDLRKCQVAHEGNGLIIEMTAYKNTVFYLQHPRFGMSNEVTISTDGNKEYYIEASLNQFFSIVIVTNRSDVDTYIDDTFAGRTNADGILTIDAVLPGTHQLKLTYGTTTKNTLIDVNRKSIYFKQEVALDTDSKTGVSRQTSTPDFCEMVFVEGGTFTMGATSEQGSDAYDDEKPTHSVTVSDFYIGKYEVTQAQWKSIMGSNPSKWKGDNLPVESVSWNDIQEFIQKLNQKTGRKYSLPTEAEWEYAARGGNKSQGYKYSGSNDIGAVAWYTNNSGDKTHPVGQKQPNELGIYDMSGNVLEWCQDWYGSYSSASQTNPTGPSSGSDRVLRGGSCLNSTRYCRVSFRSYRMPSYRQFNIGFRLVLDSSAKSATTTSTSRATSTNSTTHYPYKVGDYYNVGGKEGVVCEATSDGRHGKIISLNETRSNWEEAKSWCARLGSGWRLPTKKELQTICRVKSTLNSTLAVNGDKLENGWYWSSNEYDSSFAWYVDMYDGYTRSEGKNLGNYVRAVSAF